VAVRNAAGKVVMESILETKAAAWRSRRTAAGNIATGKVDGDAPRRGGASGSEPELPPRSPVDLPERFGEGPHCHGPLHEFYQGLLAQGRRPSMARLTWARQIAAITLIVWKRMPTLRLCLL
jgi:hypothetical protein